MEGTNASMVANGMWIHLTLWIHRHGTATHCWWVKFSNNYLVNPTVQFFRDRCRGRYCSSIISTPHGIARMRFEVIYRYFVTNCFEHIHKRHISAYGNTTSQYIGMYARDTTVKINATCSYALCIFSGWIPTFYHLWKMLISNQIIYIMI